MLTGSIILIVFAFACAHSKLRRQSRTNAGQSVHVQSRLVAPSFQQHQLVGIDTTLKYLELFTARLFHHLCAVSTIEPCELGAFSRCCCDSYDQSNCHIVSSFPASAGGMNTAMAPAQKPARRT